MSVENSANNISQLNPNWPPAEDFISEGDDHLRIIKKTLKQTFSKITDLCNISHKQLNTLAAAVVDDGKTDAVRFFGDKAAINTSGEIYSQRNFNTGSRPAQNHVVNFRSIVDMLYPVGSLYITTNNVNPATQFGFGTWVAYAQGRALTGVGEVDGRNVTGGSWGGGWNRALNTHHLPPHAHGFRGTTSSAGNHVHAQDPNTAIGPRNSGNTDVWSGSPSSGLGGTTQAAGDHTHAFSGTTDSAGSGGAFSVDQPYIGVFVWRRTA